MPSPAIIACCPAKLSPSATNADYSLDTSTLTFEANQIEATVQVTIKHDNVDEMREFFCLNISTNAGSNFMARVYIPGNDCKC